MLSTTAKYAIRALVELARMAEDERVLGHDLAARAGLPANYLSKILAALGKAGLTQATRGSGGGYRLRRPPHEVTLLRVVEILEGSQLESECLLRPGRACSPEDECAAHREWTRLREHYLDYLGETTIGALAGPAPGARPAVAGFEPGVPSIPKEG